MIKHFKLMVYAMMVINVFLNSFFTIMLIFDANEYNIYNLVTGTMAMLTLMLLASVLENIKK